MENRYSFFGLRISSHPKYINQQDRFWDNIDLILNSMGVKNTCYKFLKNDEIFVFFKTDIRKRKGQLNRISEKYIGETGYHTSMSLTKEEFDQTIQKFLKDKNT